MNPAKRPALTPEGLARLLSRAGLTQVGAAELLQINPRTMRRYISGDWPTPRVVQFALLYLLDNPA